MEYLLVERLGGLAGFGGSAARLRSRGRIDLTELTSAERDIVEALFAARAVAEPGARRDAFRYRITRRTPRGEESVEAWEHAVPPPVCACVRDEFV
jgi:hypothetical protein